MNYFELFGLPVQLKIDTNALPRKYFELSRKYHPDYFANASPEAQAEALDMSAQLNKAFKTLQSPEATIKYVLELKGLLTEEEKYPLHPSFLMEVMELNEQLMELEMEPNAALLSQTEAQTQQLIDDNYQLVAAILDNYQEAVTTEKELLQVKEYYYRKKYLERLKAKAKEMGGV